jgi:thioesterase domain-containing protein
VQRGQLGWGAFIRNRQFVRKLAAWFGRPQASRPGSDLDRQQDAEAYDLWLLDYLENLMRLHEPKEYAGKVSLFRSDEEPRGLWIDPAMGWGAFARGGVDVTVISGDHYSVFNDPGVKEMAAAIRGIIDRAGDSTAG